MPQYTLLTLRARASLWEALAVSAFILNNIIPKLQVF
ncbi:hypothetical protein CLOBOL_00002 [Enterocloster bolteae ATCC BAA-613]|uniref:Uncharacterized protein n=1 Tax=Enterocloster bolteae (strain ATCC BAA-613 / DSM 15670 / CCUG 46953 / JCM 12243 / WAL 16351) TaxID=411902 RepID=A8RFY9_ENTBW|nr:hypothetical protein CLOBOL_00002 [Enterocloster bolteae ATCC BAA-613]